MVDRRGLVSSEMGGVVVCGCSWCDFFPRRLIFLVVGRLPDCCAFFLDIEAFGAAGGASMSF
jgi:hypothetical protein